jgi:1,4-alpha-glucan branching enzyme
MTGGYLALLLHAHLPFTRNPDHEDFLEERWLFEAIAECYLPLLWMMERLADDGVDFRLALVLTPTLVSMLDDDLLRRRAERHLSRMCELADREVDRTRDAPDFHETAQMYRERFRRALADFTGRYGAGLVAAFRSLQESGRVEIVASAATHGYLPLLRMNAAAVRAQVAIGIRHYEDAFGRRPRGFWLPECGYYPGLDAVLRENGIEYFYLDRGAIAEARGPAAGYAPVECPSGVAAFVRDPDSAKQVWSSFEGYPGDFDYREFYRDIGHDLDAAYIGAYVQKDGIRTDTGFKYYRVTGKTEEKEPYVQRRALAKAERHAAHFLLERQRRIAELEPVMNRKPLVVAPFDAELFGHWWFEGPEWLEWVLRGAAADGSTVRTICPSEYLIEYPASPPETPRRSSWGLEGSNRLWLNESNDWIYRPLRAAADRMTELARAFPDAQGDLRRALQQAARELLLAQSSDWPFIIAGGTAVQYAESRVREHLACFDRLYGMIRAGAIDAGFVTHLESRDNLFPSIDTRINC